MNNRKHTPTGYINLPNRPSSVKNSPESKNSRMCGSITVIQIEEATFFTMNTYRYNNDKLGIQRDWETK